MCMSLYALLLRTLVIDLHAKISTISAQSAQYLQGYRKKSGKLPSVEFTILV